MMHKNYEVRYICLYLLLMYQDYVLLVKYRSQPATTPPEKNRNLNLTKITPVLLCILVYP